MVYPLLRLMLQPMMLRQGRLILLSSHKPFTLVTTAAIAYCAPTNLRLNGLIVDDVPRHMSHNSETATHSNFVPDEDIRIPLEMRGIVSLFHSLQPAVEELENCKWLMFTSEVEWDPHSEDFMRNKQAMMVWSSCQDCTLLTLESQTPHNIERETDSILSSISSVYSHGHFCHEILHSPMYIHPQVHSISS
jgi:hypothetical protein